ncbi:hypothetical protein ACOME3_004371 [Neoechinorhynchus agilis]
MTSNAAETDRSLFGVGLFKKFSPKENVSNSTQMKQSDVKKLRHRLAEDYPYFVPYLDLVVPRKETHRHLKCSGSVEIVAGPFGDILFFKQRQSPYVPSLRLLHQYPFLLPQQVVDKGAIRFVMSGANVMCPGLTSPGGTLNMECKTLNTVVAIHAEGVDHALAIGIMRMIPEDIVSYNKGVAIDLVHFVGDGLWQTKCVK